MPAVPNRDRRAERRSETRGEIIEAAWAVARDAGVAGLTLRDVAARVGMQSPSLYSHFASKDAIYDAMFQQSWTQWLDHANAQRSKLPGDPHRRLSAMARLFFDFSAADVARYQLMNVNSVPGFAPSAAAYAPAVRALELTRVELRGLGLRAGADLDLYTAMVSGLVDQQMANEPGGTRWRRLIPRAMGLLASQIG